MISIVIPTYMQGGHGVRMLTMLLNSILRQEISHEYEIIISDNDNTGRIKGLCDQFNMLPLKYHFNPEIGSSENMNNAINLANYDYIKIMCQDDLFTLRNSIDLFVEALNKDKWVISNSLRIKQNGDISGKQDTAYNHNQFNKNITGMPSVVGLRKCDIRFDLGLKTVQDMFFYYQLYELYGKPGVIKEYSVAQRFWLGQLSKNQTSRHRIELDFLRQHKIIKC
jgi:Glycosyl transferase family 2